MHCDAEFEKEQEAREVKRRKKGARGGKQQGMTN